MVADKLKKKTPAKAAAKQVRLRLVYIDFWVVLKLGFLVGLALAVVQVVATFLVYTVLSATGVFDRIASLVDDVAGGAVDFATLMSLPNVMGFTIVTAILLIVVVSALAAVAAVLYNIAVKITGGLLLGFTND